MVNLMARKSNTGDLSMAGFMATKEAPQAIVTTNKAATPKPLRFTELVYFPRLMRVPWATWRTMLGNTKPCIGKTVHQ